MCGTAVQALLFIPSCYALNKHFIGCRRLCIPIMLKITQNYDLVNEAVNVFCILKPKWATKHSLHALKVAAFKMVYGPVENLNETSMFFVFTFAEIRYQLHRWSNSSRTSLILIMNAKPWLDPTVDWTAETHRPSLSCNMWKDVNLTSVCPIELKLALSAARKHVCVPTSLRQLTPVALPLSPVKLLLTCTEEDESWGKIERLWEDRRWKQREEWVKMSVHDREMECECGWRGKWWKL